MSLKKKHGIGYTMRKVKGVRTKVGARMNALLVMREDNVSSDDQQ